MIYPAAFRAALPAVALLLAASGNAQRRIPKDLSGVRGFNYQSAPTTATPNTGSSTALPRPNAISISQNAFS